MRRVVFDCETNDLLDKLDRVHCLVLRDLDTGQLFSCTDSAPGYQPIKAGLSLLSEAEVVYGHNIIRFDIPALQKVYPGFQIKGKARDTYVTVCMRWAHIEQYDWALVNKGRLPAQFVGRHSLEAWGYRLGLLKSGTDIEDWSTWTPEMHARCERDVEINVALVRKIQKSGISARALETEHELAEYLHYQERNGWPFDFEKATVLQAQLSSKRETIAAKLRERYGSWLVKNGEVTPKRSQRRAGAQYVAGAPYTKIKLIEFNPGSRDHIANRLMRLHGWTPKTFTEKGKPQVDEKALLGCKFPEAPMLLEFLTIEKVLGYVSEGKQAWLKHMTKDGPEGGQLTGLYHIHHRVKQNHAITHRASHANPNIAQTPKVGNPYGAECRELFFIGGDSEWVQVGADASGLELRCLAHHMARYDDGAYGKIVLAEKPNDIHTINAIILGVDRDKAKTFIYAFLYGAGDAKLGSIIHPEWSEEKRKKLGAQLRRKFLEGFPALAALIKDVKHHAVVKGYVVGVDGRRGYIRSERAALNTLLQMDGALICKRWIVQYNRQLVSTIGPQGWKQQWASLGWIHDEVQLAVRQPHVDLVKAILVDSIRSMTNYFSFRVPLDGEAKSGRNWKDTH